MIDLRQKVLASHWLVGIIAGILGFIGISGFAQRWHGGLHLWDMPGQDTENQPVYRVKNSRRKGNRTDLSAFV